MNERDEQVWPAAMAQLSNVMQYNPGSPEPLDMTPLPLPTGREDHFELLRLASFRNLVLERQWAQLDLLGGGGYPDLVEVLEYLIEALEEELNRSNGAS